MGETFVYTNSCVFYTSQTHELLEAIVDFFMSVYMRGIDRSFGVLSLLLCFWVKDDKSMAEAVVYVCA